MVTMLPPSNFSFRDWEEQAEGINDARELPKPPDRYRPGHIKWGSNPHRGRGIQRAREAKRFATNAAFFFEHVLPLIEAELNPSAWRGMLEDLRDRVGLEVPDDWHGGTQRLAERCRTVLRLLHLH